jgi:hypothetical protein
MTLVSTTIPRASVEVNEQIECTNSTYYLHACLGLFLEGSGGWARVCGLGEIVLEGQPSLAPSTKCIFIFYIYFGGPLLDPFLDGLFLNTPRNGIIIYPSRGFTRPSPSPICDKNIQGRIKTAILPILLDHSHWHQFLATSAYWALPASDKHYCNNRGSSRSVISTARSAVNGNLFSSLHQSTRHK